MFSAIFMKLSGQLTPIKHCRSTPDNLYRTSTPRRDLSKGVQTNKAPGADARAKRGTHPSLTHTIKTYYVGVFIVHWRQVIPEQAQDTPGVVLGTFPVNSVPATVLFDFGASHSFIIEQFVAKHNISMSSMKTHLLIGSPNGEMKSTHVCPRVNLKIRGIEFQADLVLTPFFWKNRSNKGQEKQMMKNRA
jgi:hypothetical protein